MTIIDLIRKNHMTINSCSKKAKIPYATLHNICSGTSKIEDCSYATLKKLADTLEVDVNRLVNGTALEKLDRESLDSMNVDDEEFGTAQSTAHNVKDASYASYATDASNGLDVTHVQDVSDASEAKKVVVYKTSFPDYLRSVYAPSLIYAYNLMFGDGEWSPKRSMLEAEEECVRFFFSLLGIELDEAGMILNSEHFSEKETANMNSEFNAASLKTLTWLEEKYMNSNMYVQDAHLLCLAVTNFIKTAILEGDVPSLNIDTLKHTRGIFSMSEYIYSVYIIRSFYEEKENRGENNDEADDICQDAYDQLLRNLSWNIEKSKIMIPGFRPISMVLIEKGYDMYNSLYMKYASDKEKENKARQFYGMDSFFQDAPIIRRRDWIDTCMTSLIYYTLYAYDTYNAYNTYDTYSTRKMHDIQFLNSKDYSFSNTVVHMYCGNGDFSFL